MSFGAFGSSKFQGVFLAEEVFSIVVCFGGCHPNLLFVLIFAEGTMWSPSTFL